jgi:hypothetical protein
VSRAGDAGDELGEPGQTNGLTIFAVRASKDCPAWNGDEALAGDGRERPTARQAAALYGGHFEESFGLIGLTIDAQEIELSGVGHGPQLFATGPGCLGGES